MLCVRLDLDRRALKGTFGEGPSEMFCVRTDLDPRTPKAFSEGPPFAVIFLAILWKVHISITIDE